MSQIRTRHSPGPYWAERADEYDRRNGRLHLRSIVLAPPMTAGGQPEPVAYVDAEGDVALVLAGPLMLGELIEAAAWLDERADVLLKLLADPAGWGRGQAATDKREAIRTEAARYRGRAAVIRQTILKATAGG
jgi:hypothetical protein